MDKKVLGLVEEVEIIGSKKTVKTKAVIDTGATRSSIDVKIAAEAGVGPIVGSVKIKSKTAPGQTITRAIVETKIKIGGRRMAVNANIEDRSNMPCKVLIGRDVIHSNFVVDTEKTHRSHKMSDEH